MPVHKPYMAALDEFKLADGNTVCIGDAALPLGETYREGFFQLIRAQNQPCGPRKPYRK